MESTNIALTISEGLSDKFSVNYFDQMVICKDNDGYFAVYHPLCIRYRVKKGHNILTINLKDYRAAIAH